jgi:hypothetical protein
LFYYFFFPRRGTKGNKTITRQKEGDVISFVPLSVDIKLRFIKERKKQLLSLFLPKFCFPSGKRYFFLLFVSLREKVPEGEFRLPLFLPSEEKKTKEEKNSPSGTKKKQRLFPYGKKTTFFLPFGDEK